MALQFMVYIPSLYFIARANVVQTIIDELSYPNVTIKALQVFDNKNSLVTTSHTTATVPVMRTANHNIHQMKHKAHP